MMLWEIAKVHTNRTIMHAFYTALSQQRPPTSDHATDGTYDLLIHVIRMIHPMHMTHLLQMIHMIYINIYDT